jgi:hypothetical protein
MTAYGIVSDIMRETNRNKLEDRRIGFMEVTVINLMLQKKADAFR